MTKFNQIKLRKCHNICKCKLPHDICGAPLALSLNIVPYLVFKLQTITCTLSSCSSTLIQMSGTKTLNVLFLDACRNGEEAKVNAAIVLGVDINTKNSEGKTGLYIAIRNIHEHTVDILLARPDIDINGKTNTGAFPLLVAAYHGLSSVVAKLGTMPQLRGVNDQAGAGGLTPLSLAIHFGKDNKLQFGGNFVRQNCLLVIKKDTLKSLAVQSSNS